MNVRALLGAEESAELDRAERIALYRRSIRMASETRSYLATVEGDMRARRLTGDADYLAGRVTDLTRRIVIWSARLRELTEASA